jgi:hypothetical protein
MSSTSQPKQRSDVEPARKEYRSPELRVYGNIREITQGLGKNTTFDGGGPMGAGFKSLP